MSLSSLPKIETPTYVLTIPSTKQDIKYRPFLVKEEKIMLMALEHSEKGDVVAIADSLKQVIQACTFNAIDPNKLTSFDLEWIFLKLREKSKGNIAPIVFVCEEVLEDGEECGHQMTVNYDLGQVKVEENPEHTKKIMLTDTIGLMMRYPNFETFTKVNFSDFSGNATKTVNNVILDSIEMIFEGENVTMIKDVERKELEEWFENLSSPQMSKIEHFFSTMPQVVANVNYTCVCGKKQEIKVTGLENFLT